MTVEDPVRLAEAPYDQIDRELRLFENRLATHALDTISAMRESEPDRPTLNWLREMLEIRTLVTQFRISLTDESYDKDLREAGQ